LNVPSEFCMKQKLIRGSLEEKVYLDPSNLYLYVNRDSLHIPVMEFPSRLRTNSEPTSPFKKPVVPILKLKENPENKLREIRAMSRQLLENKEISESSLSSSVQNSKDSESDDEEESEEEEEEYESEEESESEYSEEEKAGPLPATQTQAKPAVPTQAKTEIKTDI